MPQGREEILGAPRCEEVYQDARIGCDDSDRQVIIPSR
jgi:hypothetical protein